MKSFAALPFQMKFIAGVVLAVIIAIAAMSSVNLDQVDRSLHVLGRTSLESYAANVLSVMEMQRALLEEKARTDLSLIHKEINSMGFPTLNRMNSMSMEVKDSGTGAAETVEVPSLDIGSTALNKNSELIDEISRKVGSDASIYLADKGRLIRVATSIEGPDGSRPLGVTIPKDSPVYAAVTAGEPYYGIVEEVDGWYQAGFMPLGDFNGKMIGVLCVERPVITEGFEKTIESLNLGGKGYGFIYSDTGRLLSHPTMKGESLERFGFWPQFRDTRDGFVQYDLQDSPKIAYVKYFEPWKMYFAFAMLESEMTYGLVDKLTRTSLIIAVCTIVGLTVIIALLMRLVQRPLRELSSYTREVSGGNYDAAIRYTARDVIAETIGSVQDMVRQLKARLAFSEGVLAGFTQPCAIVGTDHAILWTNRQMLELLGRPGQPEDYVGQSSGRFYFGDDRRESPSVQALRENRVLQTELLYTRPDGQERIIDVTATPFQDMDGTMLGSLAVWYDLSDIRRQQQVIEQQSEKIASTAMEAKEIAQHLANASGLLKEQVVETEKGSQMQLLRTTETSTAMEQMNGTVMEVARNASEAAEKADSTKRMAENGARLVSQVVDAIKVLEDHSRQLRESNDQLSSQAESIGSIMQVIEDIADQTNLLALNAAIEAARAGEAGRGFAVVADEVRKLAEKTMSATKEVGQAIHSIQQDSRRNSEATNLAVQSVQESTRLVDHSRQALQGIVDMVEQTAAQIQSIATAAEQQSASSQQINAATDEIKHISSENAQAMLRSNEAVSEVSDYAWRLRGLIDDMQG